LIEDDVTRGAHPICRFQESPCLRQLLVAQAAGETGDPLVVEALLEANILEVSSKVTSLVAIEETSASDTGLSLVCSAAQHQYPRGSNFNQP